MARCNIEGLTFNRKLRANAINFKINYGKTTTFQIKFENYDKSFKNINAITSELADMNASLKQLEEEFAKADFGSDEWKELAKI